MIVVVYINTFNFYPFY